MFRHMALMALYTSLVVNTAGKCFSLRVLQLDKTGTCDCMFKIVKIQLLVMGQQILAVLQRHMVGALISISDLSAIAPLAATSAVILHMTLGAHKSGVGLLHDSYLAKAAEISNFKIGFTTLGEDVAGRVITYCLDQGIPDHARLGSVGIMTMNTADRIIGILCYVINIGGAIPFGFRVLVPHKFPLQQVI